MANFNQFMEANGQWMVLPEVNMTVEEKATLAHWKAKRRLTKSQVTARRPAGHADGEIQFGLATNCRQCGTLNYVKDEFEKNVDFGGERGRQVDRKNGWARMAAKLLSLSHKGSGEGHKPVVVDSLTKKSKMKLVPKIEVIDGLLWQHDLESPAWESIRWILRRSAMCDQEKCEFIREIAKQKPEMKYITPTHRGWYRALERKRRSQSLLGGMMVGRTTGSRAVSSDFLQQAGLAPRLGLWDFLWRRSQKVSEEDRLHKRCKPNGLEASGLGVKRLAAHRVAELKKVAEAEVQAMD
jgi:hypothetical protein